DGSGLEKVIDHHLDGKKNLTGVSTVAEARKLLPADALAWMWLNMDTVRKAPQAAEVFAHPRNDPNLTILFGGVLDVARRAPFVFGARYHDRDPLPTTIPMPSGPDGAAPRRWAPIP